ncbi:MAG: FHA domain-containing protein [Magnetococcales bacterium]|nr:FHA domain-containing protein [Magnetococcales bacterium]
MAKTPTFLRIRHADGSTDALPLDEAVEFIIGRKPVATVSTQLAVPLKDPFASRSHCRILYVRAKASGKSATLMAAFADDDEGEATLLMGANTQLRSWPAGGWRTWAAPMGPVWTGSPSTRPCRFPLAG